MKEFNLELAKAGHPVQTKNGRPVRIICYNKVDANYPIVTLVKRLDVEKEETIHYTLDGRFNVEVKDDKFDLVMAPIKKEGWINVYRSSNGAMYTEQERIYNSEEEAIAGKFDRTYNRVYVTSKKIEWEE